VCSLSPGEGPASFTCSFVTWEDQYRLARVLAGKIRSSGYRPDVVIAIGRGGYIPARILCDLLTLSRLTSVKVEHWGTPAEKEDQAVIRYPLCTEIRGERVLIVDDVTDTGDSMRIVLGYVKGLGPSEVRTAVLQHKEVSGFLPDYYAEVCPTWQWIVYPWAFHEDLLGFTKRVLADRPLSPEEIRKELESRFRFTATEEEIGFALGDLLASGAIAREGPRYRLKTV
jgi:uncharacterized protein